MKTVIGLAGVLLAGGALAGSVYLFTHDHPWLGVLVGIGAGGAGVGIAHSALGTGEAMMQSIQEARARTDLPVGR